MSAGAASVRTETWQGLPALRLRDASGATALLSLHGGHLLSWCDPAGRERLYLSARTRSGAGQAVRGGVPVIFPKFAQRGPLAAVPRHGFARTRAWERASTAASVSAATDAPGAAACLRLIDDEATRAAWPHRFELALTVRLSGPRLAIELGCRNTGDKPWAFSAALHTYLAVHRVEGAVIDGLQAARYVDSTQGQEHPAAMTPLTLDGSEIDRIYWGGGVNRLTLTAGAQRLAIEASGFADTVVWNPGPAKAAQLDDVAAGDERGFVCIEAAAIEPQPMLQPGEQWLGVQQLTALD